MAVTTDPEENDRPADPITLSRAAIAHWIADLEDACAASQDGPRETREAARARALLLLDGAVQEIAKVYGKISASRVVYVLKRLDLATTVETIKPTPDPIRAEMRRAIGAEDFSAVEAMGWRVSAHGWTRGKWLIVYSVQRDAAGKVSAGWDVLEGLGGDKLRTVLQGATSARLAAEWVDRFEPLPTRLRDLAASLPEGGGQRRTALDGAAEIARLEAEAAKARGAASSTLVAIERANAEIERLRADIAKRDEVAEQSMRHFLEPMPGEADARPTETERYYVAGREAGAKAMAQWFRPGNFIGGIVTEQDVADAVAHATCYDVEAALRDVEEGTAKT